MPPLLEAMNRVRECYAREMEWERVEALVEDDTTLDEEERAVVWLFAWMGGDPITVADELRRRVLIEPNSEVDVTGS